MVVASGPRAPLPAENLDVMPACPRTLLALLPWCAGVALAQQPAPAPAPAPVPSAEAMERAKRDAANPMRVILEAGRLQLRRRSELPAVAATPVVAPVSAPVSAPVRREAMRSIAASEPAPVEAAPAVLESAAPEPAPAPALAERTLEAAPAAAVAPPPAEVPVAAPVAAPVVVPPQARPAPVDTVVAPVPAPVPEVVAPTLIDMVEPAIPPTVLSRIGAMREVTADLTLRPDGTVAAVALASGTPRAATRYLTQAFEQWRFAPLPAARVHRVQLVFPN